MRQLAYLIVVLTGCLILACVLFYDATKTLDAQIQIEVDKINKDIHN